MDEAEGGGRRARAPGESRGARRRERHGRPFRPGHGALPRRGRRRRGSVLGVFRSSSGATPPRPRPNRDGVNALGGLIGSELGDAYGLGGLGLTGLGSIGNLGTIGKSVGGAPRTQRGPQVASRGPCRSAARSPRRFAGVIRGHLRELQYCYEVQLQRHPAARGPRGCRRASNDRSPDGSVAGERVQSSTLGNNHVEQCVVGAMGRWRFRGGPGWWRRDGHLPVRLRGERRLPTPVMLQLVMLARVAVARKAADLPNAAPCLSLSRIPSRWPGA